MDPSVIDTLLNFLVFGFMGLMLVLYTKTPPPGNEK